MISWPLSPATILYGQIRGWKKELWKALVIFPLPDSNQTPDYDGSSELPSFFISEIVKQMRSAFIKANQETF
jgi:hypothetical protein